MKLYPTILTDSLATFEEQLNWSKESQAAQVVQVDIMDGFFAPEITVSPLDIAVFDFGELQLDLHLMVEEPLDFVFEASALKDALPVRAVIGQVERMSFQRDFIAEVRRQEWKVGLSLDLYTPVESIDTESWEHLDVVQVMTVEAGAQGKTFQPMALEKCREVAAIIARLPQKVELVVDGGVKADEALLTSLREAGVHAVSVGSALWTASDPVAALRSLSGLVD